MNTSNLETLMADFSGNQWPEFKAIEQHQDTAKISLYISESIHWFTGHFPNAPVLPGVVQTHWAARLCEYLYPEARAFTRIDNLKFQSVIMPKQHVLLTIKHIQPKSAFTFSYTHEGNRLSEGKLIFNNV